VGDLGYSAIDQIAQFGLSSLKVIYYSEQLFSRGDQVSAKTLTSTFKKARDKSGLTWEEGTAPTFHEQRSLSERLYREQGIDTQKLLGHKTMKMTDRYNDDRGKEWIIVGKKAV
ncbi:tyrosine-type recombinase/integrase, partial [Klebsiella pneumoniae]|uniref:tyrosine-type recombinase/integrase n=1 Tax=Klebsiella pneumoniae TaxID=573 RepID=UPI002169C96C